MAIPSCTGKMTYSYQDSPLLISGNIGINLYSGLVIVLLCAFVFIFHHFCNKFMYDGWIPQIREVCNNRVYMNVVNYFNIFTINRFCQNCLFFSELFHDHEEIVLRVMSPGGHVGTEMSLLDMELLWLWAANKKGISRLTTRFMLRIRIVWGGFAQRKEIFHIFFLPANHTRVGRNSHWVWKFQIF